jgi:hypothetical protein
MAPNSLVGTIALLLGVGLGVAPRAVVPQHFKALSYVQFRQGCAERIGAGYRPARKGTRRQSEADLASPFTYRAGATSSTGRGVSGPKPDEVSHFRFCGWRTPEAIALLLKPFGSICLWRSWFWFLRLRRKAPARVLLTRGIRSSGR